MCNQPSRAICADVCSQSLTQESRLGQSLAARRQNGAHDLKYCVHKILVQGSMLQKQAKVERTIKHVENCIGIEVGANLTFFNRLLQQFARLDSPWFNPMGPKGLQYFWVGLSRPNHRGNNLAERTAEYHRPPSHLLVNGLQDRPG